jgi:hypothetical protein
MGLQLLFAWKILPETRLVSLENAGIVTSYGRNPMPLWNVDSGSIESAETSAAPFSGTNSISMVPSRDAESNERSTPLSALPAAEKISKRFRMIFPLISTLNSRMPASPADGSSNFNVTR